MLKQGTAEVRRQTVAVPYFSILNSFKLQPYLISEFPLEQNPSSTFFQYFEWKKTALFLFF